MSDAQWPHAGAPVCLSPLRCPLNTALLSTIFYSLFILCFPLSYFIQSCDFNTTYNLIAPKPGVPAGLALVPVPYA